MPIRDTSGLGQRTARELVHADFEVARNFVEMAQNESERDLAGQLLFKAEGILSEIRLRLGRMSSDQREAVEAQLKELSESIERTRAPGFRISDGSET
ncbi:MAG TPA: hypothetical protein VK789_14195 [Bryobacteraceae bacterium]|jgi:hypothetical protein|nr:hypothetical protein [Bryobacteraceae bacterium]